MRSRSRLYPGWSTYWRSNEAHIPAVATPRFVSPEPRQFQKIASMSSDILSSMRHRTSQMVAILVLLICLICPVLEMFDQWDHTAQTGNDTEYTFVVLGLCIGVLYTFARFAFGFPVLKSVIGVVSSLCAHKSLLSDGQGSFFIIHIPLSPPGLALRI
jgi:hypothetical protein